MNTSFPAFSVPSRFRIFDCTSPKVENTRSTPALDTTAVSIDLHKSSMSSFRRLACDCLHVREDTEVTISCLNMYGLNGPVCALMLTTDGRHVG